MTRQIQDINRREIRQKIGRNVGDVIVGEATSTVDNASLLDNYALFKGGDDHYNSRQVMIYDAAGSIVDGEKSRVSDYAAATWDCTMAPVFSAAVTDGDKYEMWKTFTVEEINEVIDDIIIDISSGCLQVYQTETTFTEKDKYIYDCLSSFEALHSVEYLHSTGVYKDLHMCDSAWSAVDSDVTQSIDTTLHREGSGCLKLVVASGASANDILATVVISSTDISGCDRIEIWTRSSSALAAGDMQLLLDDTALCASPLETLNIPVSTADTSTYHSIALANAYLDTAIISLGIKMVTDATFTFYIDRIRAVNSKTRKYLTLNPEQWSIVRGTTNYLELIHNGKAVCGDNTLLRLSGYSLPPLLTDDTTDTVIDPAYIIAEATARLLLNHAKSSSLDVDNRQAKADRWKMTAEKLKNKSRTNYAPNTRLC